MSHWFFLSYARDNLDDYHKEFYRDLNDAVRRQTVPGEGTDGFFDTKGIEVGKPWPETLTTALQTCRVFVSLYSPAYFASEYCGKEWQIFSTRQSAYAAGLPSNAARPALLMPVLWVSERQLLNSLPPAAAAVQYKHSDFDEVYAREGLRRLMALKRYRDDYYDEFLERFADKLVQAARAHILPPAPALPPISEIESAFHRRGGRSVQSVVTPRTAGPRFVQFFFVAARREEIEGVREKLDPYGEEGGYDWLPYLPEVQRIVALLAQEVAHAEGFIYESVGLDDNIVRRIEEAQNSNKIVAIVVDTWTLRLPQYQAAMQAYDKCTFLNSLVTILWNKQDEETERFHTALRDSIRAAFPNHTVRRDPDCFLDSISSRKELKRQLPRALIKARMRITERAEVVKRAESGLVIGKPVIFGPVKKELDKHSDDGI